MTWQFYVTVWRHSDDAAMRLIKTSTLTLNVYLSLAESKNNTSAQYAVSH